MRHALRVTKRVPSPLVKRGTIIDRRGLRRAYALAALLCAASALAIGCPAADAQTVPNTYVALGDSYTAGPLVPNPTGDPVDCGRSDHNYPSLVAAALHAPVFRDVSCGSAQIEDFSDVQDGLPLGGANPPQYNALGPDTALVTVGIGGNDIGFGGIVNHCVQPPAPLGTPCTPYYKRNGGDELSERIQETAPRIAGVLQEIHRRAPAADVFVVDYPALLPDDGSACYPYVPILPEDIPYLRDKEKELNAMLATQAAANGATHVDWYTPSIGHDACKPPTIAWTNGAIVVPPSYPAHPNADGLTGAAAAVLEAVERSGFTWPADGETEVLSASQTRGGSPATNAIGGVTPQLPATGPSSSLGAGALIAALSLIGMRRLRRG